MSSPHLLQRDFVNLYEQAPERRNLRGPATATLLGGSVSTTGELHATGVSFSVSGGLIGFVTFALPAALLVPGGGFFIAYRLYRLVRDAAALKRYARVSRAAPHVAIAVAASDAQITRDEARLLRDLLRGRVGSPAERREILRTELDPRSRQGAAFEALEALKLEPGDWPSILSIAIATAHADHEYSGVEQEVIAEFRRFTQFSEDEFASLAADAEADYMDRRHVGEAMVRACYQIARASGARVPDDARLLLDVVLCAAVPSDAERAQLAALLEASDEPTAMSREELTRGADEEVRSLFRRVGSGRSDAFERTKQFAQTLASFVATLESWRGWVVRDCRRELFALGAQYGHGERQLAKWVQDAHKNIASMRPEWIAPRPWEGDDDATLDRGVVQAETAGVYRVRALDGGRFHFQVADTGWEWKSSTTEFDEFCRTTMEVDVDELAVVTDEMTFQLLAITLEAHESTIRVRRA